MGLLIIGCWPSHCIDCRGLLRTIGFLCRYLSGLKNGDNLPCWGDIDGLGWTGGDAGIIEKSSWYLLPLDIFHVSLLVPLGIDDIDWRWFVTVELEGIEFMRIRVEWIHEGS